MRVSLDVWLAEAKKSDNANKVGMWLCHNGVVRSTAKAFVREGRPSTGIKAMNFSYDKEKLCDIISRGERLAGIYFLRVELNEGLLSVGDDLMYVLIGADTRLHAVEALNKIVGEIKDFCVTEEEIPEKL